MSSTADSEAKTKQLYKALKKLKKYKTDADAREIKYKENISNLEQNLNDFKDIQSKYNDMKKIAEEFKLQYEDEVKKNTEQENQYINQLADAKGTLAANEIEIKNLKQ